jgi:polar amino acid transport system substrate-binding protein
MNILTTISTLLLITLQPAFADTAPITIGAEDAAAPWSDANGNGYVNDLVIRTFKKAGQPVNLDVLPYARCKLAVIRGSLVGCFSTSKTPELEADLIYPKHPVFFARNVLFTTDTSPITGCATKYWEEAGTVGLVNNYEYNSAVMNLANSAFNVEKSSDEALLLKMLSINRIDGAIITVDEVKSIDSVAARAGVPNKFRAACDFGGNPAYVVFSRAHPKGKASARTFDRGYELLLEQGEIEQLQKKWRSNILYNPDY